MKSFYLDWNGFVSVAMQLGTACLSVRTWGYCQCVCPEQKTDTLGFQFLVV